MFVGVDPSISNTGVVILNTSGDLVKAFNGSDSGSGKRNKTDYYLLRYQQQVEYIRSILSRYTGILNIAYEDYSFNSVHKAYSLAEYNGLLKAGLYSATSRVPIFVAPRRAKKFATTHGDASKEEMISRALQECPELNDVELCSRVTEDVCDAYFLAKMAWYYSCMEHAVKEDRGVIGLRMRVAIIRKLQEVID